ncbi:dATP/dGTP pyrophosphohydrolase domain-containing protein [Ewingella americana]|uniref:DUF550 domain-containing protein n=1 Tax=Ewingella americana TaxID=41202 RepID=A0A502GE46_9GAMM|nr:dATP/dGTP pyrophosphohydrolase domain-containing protein [Ewingella americana]TPG60144.1 DUF550 domain-containing protein [Ewingella americana]
MSQSNPDGLINYHPAQYEIWFPYVGKRYKDYHDIKTKEGHIYSGMFPNGINWMKMVVEEGDAVKGGTDIPDTEVVALRLMSTERLNIAGKRTDAKLRLARNLEMNDGKVPREKPFSLEEFIEDKKEFSIKAFGPDYSSNRILDHIIKEVAEARKHPKDVMEWIDIIHLGLDGAWRSGTKTEHIINALESKLELLKMRDYPDWRTADENKPIEHIRDDEVYFSIKLNMNDIFSENTLKDVVRIINDQKRDIQIIVHNPREVLLRGIPSQLHAATNQMKAILWADWKVEIKELATFPEYGPY